MIYRTSPIQKSTITINHRRVQCSGGRPTPSGIEARLRPCRRSRSGSTDSPRKAADRSETERSYHHSPLQQQEEETELNTPLINHQRVQCSRSRPTPSGIEARLRPCRRSRSGSTDSPRKAAVRSETERYYYDHSPLQQQEKETELNINPSITEECSAAKDKPTPAGIEARLRPCRRSRSGSTDSPQESGRPQRNGTFHLPPLSTQLQEEETELNTNSPHPSPKSAAKRNAPLQSHTTPNTLPTQK